MEGLGSYCPGTGSGIRTEGIGFRAHKDFRAKLLFRSKI